MPGPRASARGELAPAACREPARSACRGSAAGILRGVVFAGAGTAVLVWASGDVLRAPTGPAGASFQNLLVAGAAALAWILFGWLLLAGVAVVASAVQQTPGARRTRHRVAALAIRLTPAGGQGVAALILGIALLPSATPPASAADHNQGGLRKVTSLSSTSLDRPAAPVESVRRDAVPRQIVVRRGDSLWSLAAHRLAAQRPGTDPAAAEIAAEWPSWYTANRSTIGPDPDLIRPGQRLRVPHNRLHSHSPQETP